MHQGEEHTRNVPRISKIGRERRYQGSHKKAHIVKEARDFHHDTAEGGSDADLIGADLNRTSKTARCVCLEESEGGGGLRCESHIT